MVFEKINADDTLNQGRIKINNILDDVKSQTSQLSESIVEFSDTVKNTIADESYNLLPFEPNQKNVNGILCDYFNGVLTITGTATSSGGRTQHIVDLTLPSGSYSFSISATPVNVILQKSNNKILCNLSSAGVQTFVLTESTDIYIGISIAEGISVDTAIEVMIVSGSSKEFQKPMFSAKDIVARKNTEYVDAIKQINYIPSIPNVGVDHWIRYDGLIYKLTDFVYTDIIQITKGQKIKFKANAGSPNAVSMLSLWGENGEFIKSIHTCTSTRAEIVEHTAESLERLRLSYQKETLEYCEITGGNPNKTGDLFPKIKQYDIFPFASIGVIGDSLASGASNYVRSDGVISGMDRPNYSWGKFIERSHGIPTTLFTKGGASTRSWLDQSNDWGVTAMQNADPKDLYIIGLGVNDYYSLGEAYLGNESQIVTDANAQQSDTYYGNYSKIICMLKQKSPRCKIFCLTNPGAPDAEIPATASKYNVAVRTIVNAFSDNVHLIELENDFYCKSEEALNFWYHAHSTAIGYASMAEHLWRRMNDYIYHNFDKFLDVQWIQQNHD